MWLVYAGIGFWGLNMERTAGRRHDALGRAFRATHVRVRGDSPGVWRRAPRGIPGGFEAGVAPGAHRHLHRPGGFGLAHALPKGPAVRGDVHGCADVLNRLRPAVCCGPDGVLHPGVARYAGGSHGRAARRIVRIQLKPEASMRLPVCWPARRIYFLFNFRLMTAFLRESKELRVLGPLEAPWKSAFSS